MAVVWVPRDYVGESFSLLVNSREWSAELLPHRRSRCEAPGSVGEEVVHCGVGGDKKYPSSQPIVLIHSTFSVEKPS
mgnify:CR=1 FL=1